MDRFGARWPAYGRWMPWLLIAAGVAVDVVTPPVFTGSPLLALAGLLAAVNSTLRHTVAVCVAAVLAMTLLGLVGDQARAGHDVVDIVNVTFAGLISVDVNRLIARHARRLHTARTVAEAAQFAVLPTPPKSLRGLDIAASYQGAEAEAQVGGDLYAVEETAWGVRFLVGDVRGKGLGAVGTAAVALGAFREVGVRAPELTVLADEMERSLLREARHREGTPVSEGFTTVVLGTFAPDLREVRLLTRGHPDPYLFVDGAVTVLAQEAPGVPLGLGELAPGNPPAKSFPVPPGAILLLVTDGVTEARDPDGRFYDPAERLAGRRFRCPEELLTTVAEDVRAWTGGQRDDDMALLALMRPSAPHPPGPESGAPGLP
ncbi:PP2C family protein-serine/threonine phosphatase [Streptomyces sp. NPDC048172]|uniref:PP2C family protein-serine/threonine phosphatase n=1 Tax=Streptomyces sp. NPDC048172 TaxID=3365505 RepID=UPI0037249F6F